MSSVALLDRRPEALARFGQGLRHGQRVCCNTERTGSGGACMTVLGVGCGNDSRKPCLFLLPDQGWAGGGVLFDGRTDHWASLLVPLNEEDVVPVSEERL